MHWWQKHVKNAHFGEVSGENKDTGEHVTLEDICWGLHLLMKPRSASIETSVLPLSSTRRPAFPFSVLSQHPRKWLGPALIPFCRSAGPQTCSLTLSFQRDVSHAYTPCWTILAVQVAKTLLSCVVMEHSVGWGLLCDELFYFEGKTHKHLRLYYSFSWKWNERRERE